MTVDVPDAWLTSREQLRWAGPWPVEVLGLLPGPVPDRQYGVLRAGDLRLVAADRHHRSLALPRPGAPLEVAVWSRPEAVPAPDAAVFAPDRPDPDAWCTLCAGEDEATAVATDTRAAHDRAGWRA